MPQFSFILCISGQKNKCRSSWKLESIRLSHHHLTPPQPYFGFFFSWGQTFCFSKICCHNFLFWDLTETGNLQRQSYTNASINQQPHQATKPLPICQYNKQWSNSTQGRPRSLACTSSWFLHDNCLNLRELSCPVSKERSQRTVGIQLNNQGRQFPLFPGAIARPRHLQNG